MSLVDDIAERQQRPRFGGWPRPTWTPRTNREPGATVFDEGDVMFLAGQMHDAEDVRVMLVDAAAAELDADAVDVVGDPPAKADYYRDYARTLRAACRMAQDRLDATAPAPLPGRVDAADVKRRTDIVAFIERDVPLRKAGRDRYVGLCPFHEDRSPSFTVWTDGRWHCFGCGLSGDVFAYVMRRRGCDFHEALQIVAGGS